LLSRFTNDGFYHDGASSASDPFTN
jgi:hypothetical protein